MRLFDVLPDFYFSTSETTGDYYLETWYIRVSSRIAKRLKTEDLGKLKHTRKLSLFHRMITLGQVFVPK